LVHDQDDFELLLSVVEGEDGDVGSEEVGPQSKDVGPESEDEKSYQPSV
jgi:hypothetical protein